MSGKLDLDGERGNRPASDAAQMGASLARRGGSFVRGVVLCGFALLWGHAALAGGLIGGSLPSLIGIGALALIAAMLARRAFAGARDGATTATPDEPVSVSPSFSGSARTITYRRGRLVLAACGYGVLAPAGVALAFMMGGPRGLMTIIAATSMGAHAIASLVRAMGDGVALRYDATGLTVKTLWSRRSAPWREVGQITLRRTRTSAFFGLIPISSRMSIVVRFGRGMWSRKMVLRLPLLDLGGGGVEPIAAELCRLQAGGGNREASHSSPRSPARQSPVEGGFDPDAAIARFLAANRRATSRADAKPGFSAPVVEPIQFGRRRA